MTELPEGSGFPQRSRPAHPALVEHGNRAIVVFLTVCTKRKQPLLASVEFERALQTAWLNATHWTVGRYVIMPDHIHLFCAPGVLPPTALANWVRHWKTAAGKSIKAPPGTLWQRDFWDTQLRGHESYQQKWEYVRKNPVRAGLVSAPDAWPYQGELNVLPWHA